MKFKERNSRNHRWALILAGGDGTRLLPLTRTIAGDDRPHQALLFLMLTQVVGKAPTFWLYAAVNIEAWLFAFLLVPETKGKTLEQIETYMRSGKHPRAL